jgi:LmbE family N-acetylglucosaminyl deacetylase
MTYQNQEQNSLSTNHHLKLMCILAHPDDESMGTGGILARYCDEGVATYLVTATHGERGWFGKPEDYPGPQELAKIREKELHAAAEVLGLREVNLMNYVDGELDQADPGEVIAKLVDHIRRIKPHIVVTFGPYGIYGHPDHIAISQFATSAVLAAANPDYHTDPEHQPHQVKKLYYRVILEGEAQAYQAAFGDLVMNIDGSERRTTAWPEWAVTTRIKTAQYWPKIWKAISNHCSQLPGYQALENLPEEHHRNLWSEQTYYRALSLVNGGRGIEEDLFAGIEHRGG